MHPPSCRTSRILDGIYGQDNITILTEDLPMRVKVHRPTAENYLSRHDHIELYLSGGSDARHERLFYFLSKSFFFFNLPSQEVQRASMER